LFSLWIWGYLEAGPQTEGGNRAIAPPRFSQTYVFVRCSNKLHHFAPPENISWLRPCLEVTSQCFRFLAEFTWPWAPTHWDIFWLKVFF